MDGKQLQVSLLASGTSVNLGSHQYIMSPQSEATVKEGKSLSLRGAWEVRVGLIPGQALPDYTRTFVYSSDDYERDRSAAAGDETAFVTLREQAFEYAKDRMNPHAFNWVEVVWIWY